MLRQPLEDGQVCIIRAAQSLTYPVSFMLVAAMNPCNFSYLGDPIHPCTCTLLMIERYRNRLSGPLLDRIGLHIEVPRVPYKELADLVDAESSATVRALVEAARSIKNQRLAS